jgi:hypothetical protein
MLKTVVTVGGGGTSGLTYKGTWNASTNTPTLTSGSGVNGDYYVVNVAGNTDLDGITDWQIGDWAIFNGAVWQKIDQSDTVTSVNGQVGAVVLNAANVGAAANTVNVIAGTGLTGGGALTGNVTITLANTAVAAGTYGTATDVSQITVDAQGRITSATNVAIAISTANVSGLGTMATQNANAVVITGGDATLANVTVTSNLYANLATSNTAAMPDPSLPLAPEGYITVYVNGNAKKIPYYGV